MPAAGMPESATLRAGEGRSWCRVWPRRADLRRRVVGCVGSEQEFHPALAGEDSGHLAVVQGRGHFRMSAYEEIGRSVVSNTVPDDDKWMSGMQTECDIHMVQLYVLDAAEICFFFM